MKQKLIVGNWKMYIESPEEAKKFASSLRKKSRLFSKVDVVIAPAFSLLPTVAAALKGSNIRTSAQSVSKFDDEKRTGEVSAKMVKLAGATYAIVGHSERRAMGESDEAVRAQLDRASEVGLTAILCIGELERDPSGAHFTLLEQQITSAFKGAIKTKVPKVVIAYEPVWAIGKSAQSAMSAADVRETVIFIRKTLADMFDRKIALKIPILYGAAVEAENARTLMVEGDISGLLVGHASSELDSFVEILKAVSVK